MLMSMVPSPSNGAATGLAITTDLSINEVSASSTGTPPSCCLLMLAGDAGGAGDEAATDAACNADDVVSAAAKSSATNRSSSNTPVTVPKVLSSCYSSTKKLTTSGTHWYPSVPLGDINKA